MIKNHFAEFYLRLGLLSPPIRTSLLGLDSDFLASKASVSTMASSPTPPTFFVDVSNGVNVPSFDGVVASGTGVVDVAGVVPVVG